MRTLLLSPGEIGKVSADLKTLVIVGEQIVKKHIQNQHVNSIASSVCAHFQLVVNTDIHMKFVIIGRDSDHVETVIIVGVGILKNLFQITLLTIISESLFYGHATAVNM